MDHLTTVQERWFSPGTLEEAQACAPQDVLVLLVAVDRLQAEQDRTKERLRYCAELAARIDEYMNRLTDRATSQHTAMEIASIEKVLAELQECLEVVDEDR